MSRTETGHNHGFGSWLHLALRFMGSLNPVGPGAESQRWALDQLLPGESSLFASMSGPDRRHAIGVARGSLRLAGEQDLSDVLAHPGAERAFVAAALLHDVGKNQAHLGTFGRVFATLAAVGLGRERVISWGEPAQVRQPWDSPQPSDSDESPPDSPGTGRLRSRIARYLQHDVLGAELLEQAGSERLTIDWARDHHLPESRWSVDRRLGECLKLADGD